MRLAPVFLVTGKGQEEEIHKPGRFQGVGEARRSCDLNFELAAAKLRRDPFELDSVV
jgi:hypothetical protein